MNGEAKDEKGPRGRMAAAAAAAESRVVVSEKLPLLL